MALLTSDVCKHDLPPKTESAKHSAPSKKPHNAPGRFSVYDTFVLHIHNTFVYSCGIGSAVRREDWEPQDALWFLCV